MRTANKAALTAVVGFLSAGCNLVADLGDEPILVPAAPNTAGAGGAAGLAGSGGTAGTSAGGAAGATGGTAGKAAGGNAGNAGSAGSAGTAGTAGVGGTAGGSAGNTSGGSAGASGTAGAGGLAGNAGSAGSAGAAGQSGSGGTAGQAGNAGAAGASGAGGEAGVGGEAGAGGGAIAPTCTDLERNGGEADVDCGGPCAKKCADGLLCSGGDDCESRACFNGKCRVPKCDDELANGTEADVDCGGDCTKKCSVLSSCKVDADCESGACVQGPNAKLCLQPTCDDGRKNGAETGVDCGGSCNTRCADGLGCKTPGDCLSGVCTGDTCTAPSCTDTVQNGDEPDADCGGSCPAQCTIGRDCVLPTDCDSGVCANKTCAAQSCTNGAQGVGETDIDCGGTACGPCDLGKKCLVGDDCVTRNCVATTCALPTCSDGAQNQNETDIDCGGPCNPCVVGKGCVLGKDCDSLVCINDRCVAPTCQDTIQNGTETDVDCGAACGPAGLCRADQGCADPSDCASGLCMNNVCQPGCSDIACGSDATCQIVSGAAKCVCRTDFVGDGATCQAVFAVETRIPSVDGVVNTATNTAGVNLPVDSAATPSQAFFDFPLTAIPPGAVITEASLRFTSLTAPLGTNKIGVTHFRDGFGKPIASLDAATRPPVAAPAPATTLPGFTPTLSANTNHTVVVPVSLVQQRVDVGGAFHVRLHATSGSAVFGASENANAALRPVLTVKYRRVIGSYVAPLLADTWARSNTPNATQPAGDLTIGRLLTPAGAMGAAYLRFDVATARAAIPSYAVVSGATFAIVGKGGFAYGGDGNSYLSELTDDTWTEDGLTWANRPTAADPASLSWFLFWDSPNNDADKPEQAVFRFSKDLGVRAAVAGKQNLSLLLSCSGYRHRYWSRDATDQKKAPRLVLTTVAK